MNRAASNALVVLLVAAGLALIVGVVVEALPLRSAATTAAAAATPAAAPSPAEPKSSEKPEARLERVSIERLRERDVSMQEARFYAVLDNGRVQCTLCPNYCLLGEGERGACRARANVGGKLRTLVYGRIVAANVDPIEKKPLFHLRPGASALSIATAGCNLGCVFCQNWQISQASPEDAPARKVTPDWVVEAAIKTGAECIAYTYNEPTVFYEFMYDTCALARKRGIRNVWVTCGYINPEPLRKLCKVMDGVHVDLKGFSDLFYTRYSAGRLEPVLETMKILKEEGVWFEITNLVIPDVNDDPKQLREMCKWIMGNLGPDTPIHFTRFHPDYKMLNKPPTPLETLDAAAAIAREEGLRYVYVGNVRSADGGTTFCPQCRRAVIRRQVFTVLQNDLKDGRCPSCGAAIPGVWRPAQPAAAAPAK